MPLTYLDSSVLVKRYVPEIGSVLVARLCREEPVATSLLAVPEIASALARRTREGVLSADQSTSLFQALARDAQSMILVTVDQTLGRQAATLLLAAPPHIRLRALDALHVASAQRAFARARRRGLATGSFVTADRALIEAANWVGLSALNPEDYP
jgi:predicted nucleic acid-binding protein